MDLNAYLQIEDLERILKENGIELPRLRGIDLCKNLTPWSDKEILQVENDIRLNTCDYLCESEPFWNPKANCYVLDSFTDERKRKYIEYIKDEDGYEIPSRIKWENIHGRKRKILKTEIHNRLAEFYRYVDVWNKYCGKEDVVRVHTRMGGGNWSWDDPDWIKRRSDIVSAPWFIERIDDYYDSTYCDFFCKIKL